MRIPAALSVSINGQISPLRFDFDRQKTSTFSALMGMIGQGRFKQAMKAIRRLELEDKGAKQADLHWLRGRVRIAQGDHFGAMREYSKAIQEDKDHGSAQASMGEALCLIGQFKEAIDHLQIAAKLRPYDADIPRLIGEACLGARQIESATAYFLKALNIDPKNYVAWMNFANALHAQGRIEDALLAAQKFISMHKGHQLSRIESDAHGSYIFMSMAKEHDYRRIMEYFESWAATFGANEWDFKIPRPGKDRKIRVGYVGSDFHHHAALSIYRPLFELADKEEFELYAYSGTTKPDAMTDRIKACFDKWREVHALTDEQLCAQVAKDQIDILIDLNGHTSGNRLLAFVQKPAPIQITGLGFVSALNIPQFDFFLTDAHITTPDRAEVTHDKPLYVPSIMHFQPPPDGSPLPDEQPFTKNRFITFGCANNLYKISEQVIGVWAGILKRVPKSKMAIKAKQLDCDHTRKRVVETFAKFGVSEDYLILQGQTSFDSHIAFMGGVDVALDPFPYQGGVTTNEALYMGCPVINLDTGTRTGTTAVKHTGLKTVADDLREYADKAVEVAKAIQQGQYPSKAEIRERFLNSPVCDSLLYVRSIEAAMRQVFDIYQDAIADETPA